MLGEEATYWHLHHEILLLEDPMTSFGVRHVPGVQSARKRWGSPLMAFNPTLMPSSMEQCLMAELV